MKFITKSQDYVKSDGRVDSELDNTSAATNTGREMRKVLYNNALSRSFKKNKLADIFKYCDDFKKVEYTRNIPIRVMLTRRFDDEVNKFLFHSATGEANAVGRAWLQEIILRIPTHELNSEPSFKFLSQFNGNKEIDLVFNSISMYKGDIQGNGNKNLLITTATQPPELVVLVFQPQTVYR